VNHWIPNPGCSGANNGYWEKPTDNWEAQKAMGTAVSWTQGYIAYPQKTVLLFASGTRGPSRWEWLSQQAYNGALINAPPLPAPQKPDFPRKQASKGRAWKPALQEEQVAMPAGQEPRMSWFLLNFSEFCLSLTFIPFSSHHTSD
jgi:hypothetical protein